MNYEILQGDCLNVLKTLPSESVQTCITSPPYFGLRDYGVIGQIGLEKTVSEYVQKLVEVFSEVRRVLKTDGTCWLNLGDTFSNFKDCKSVGQTLAKGTSREDAHVIEKGLSHTRDTKVLKSQGFKNKEIMGVPWRVAFALQENGWWLRQDIIWNKPNPMPESVTDRCTKSHEYIFLLTKSDRYYFDNQAIREPQQESSLLRLKRGWNGDGERGYVNGPQNHLQNYFGKSDEEIDQLREIGRNKRSVWTVNLYGYKEAHFATFPEKLIEPCVLAGSKEGDTVLDIFNGAGTTGLVALKHKRNYIGIELNPEYINITRKRLSDVQVKLF